MKKLLMFTLIVLVLIPILASCIGDKTTTTTNQENPPENLAQPSEGLEFELNIDGESYSVTGIGTCTDTDIVIPSTYKDLPVTSIGDYAFEGCESIRRVIIPDSVISIDGWAFSACRSLESIEIPNSVMGVGHWAFAGCTSLKRVVLPNSITSIEPRLFYGCSLLESVDIPDSVISIGSWSFAGCSSLKSIIISDCVTVIGASAFMGCNALTINCESETQPDGWNSDWNSSNRPVVWGYKGE